MQNKWTTAHIAILDEWHKAVIESDQQESILDVPFWEHIEYKFMKEYDQLIELRASQAIEPPKSDLLDMGKQRAIWYLRGYKKKVHRLNILYGAKLIMQNLRMAYYATSTKLYNQIAQLKEENRLLKRDISQREWAIWMYIKDCDRLYKNVVFYCQMEHLSRKSSDDWFNSWFELKKENSTLRKQIQQLQEQLNSYKND